MSGLVGFVDTRRTMLAITGADARAVLQGVVTNDVDKVAPGHGVYAALLTPQGKYLFDFFLINGGADRVLIDIAADRAAALAGRLKMYCMRRDAEITSEPDLAVALLWSGQAGASTPAAPGPAATVVADPRLPALGWRCYAPDGPKVLATLGAATATSADYDALRVANIVPEGGAELIAEDSYILEMGFERLSGVDFRKGCYVGQEVTARMKHKTSLRKGLVQVRIDGEATPGMPIINDGKPAGTLFTTADGHGLAHLRFDRAGNDMTAGDAAVGYFSETTGTPGAADGT